MLIPTIIKALVLIEREILMKLLNALPKRFQSSQIKLIFFIIEGLHSGKKEYLIEQYKIMRMLSG